VIHEEYDVLSPEQVAEAIAPLATVTDTDVTNGRSTARTGTR
jgi:hypothetical protein